MRCQANKKRLTLDIPVELHTKLKMAAMLQNTSMLDLMIESIEEKVRSVKIPQSDGS